MQWQKQLPLNTATEPLETQTTFCSKRKYTDIFLFIESEISVDSTYEVQGESLYDRVIALKDMIPPQSRRRIVSTVSSISDMTKSTFSFSGKALWVISTSAFLLGVPWALAFAEEEQYVQMEREQGMMRGANEVSVVSKLQDFLSSTRIDRILMIW